MTCPTPPTRTRIASGAPAAPSRPGEAYTLVTPETYRGARCGTGVGPETRTTHPPQLRLSGACAGERSRVARDPHRSRAHIGRNSHAPRRSSRHAVRVTLQRPPTVKTASRYAIDGRVLSPDPLAPSALPNVAWRSGLTPAGQAAPCERAIPGSSTRPSPAGRRGPAGDLGSDLATSGGASSRRLYDPRRRSGCAYCSTHAGDHSTAWLGENWRRPAAWRATCPRA